MKTIIAPDGSSITVPVGRILTFGLDGKQNDLIIDSFPSKEYELLNTTEATDLIAVPATVLIINSAALDEDSRNLIFEYYTEIGACMDETVFWIGSPKPPHPVRLRFKCYDHFGYFASELKYNLLNAHRKKKRVKSFSKQISDCLIILSSIHSHPGIRTQELSKKLELPIRTIQRHIAALQAAGEWIECDTMMRGWQLQCGISILFGDHLDNSSDGGNEYGQYEKEC